MVIQFLVPLLHTCLYWAHVNICIWSQKDEIEFRGRAGTAESIYQDTGNLPIAEVDPDRRNPHITQIYFCATMWHENDKEMLLMMKSVLRLADILNFCWEKNLKKKVRSNRLIYMRQKISKIFISCWENKKKLTLNIVKVSQTHVLAS